MFGIAEKSKVNITDKTVYLEMFGDNRIFYRVTSGKISGENIYTYGIEAEDSRTGEKETIPDFSRNIEDAVHFAESLIKNRVRPKQIYGKALSYLLISI